MDLDNSRELKPAKTRSMEEQETTSYMVDISTTRFGEAKATIFFTERVAKTSSGAMKEWM